MTSLARIIVLITAMALGFSARASVSKDNGFEQWLENQFVIAKTKLKANISRSDTLPGTVVASPSKHEPNYYYHWVRDAGLVMLTVDRLRAYESDASERKLYLNFLYEFVELTKTHQTYPAPGGLGEVKFNVDGTPFTGPWGRPQNDGPALRAYVLTKLANLLLDMGAWDYVLNNLYDGLLPSQTVIKRDLEYVAHNWRYQDFDLWEEVKGHHFFTRVAQRRALREGAKLAMRLGDQGAAIWYALQADSLSEALEWHWDGNRGFINSTLNRVDGIDYKGGLDSSVIIGAIEAERDDDNFFTIGDDRYMASINKMREAFGSSYDVNQRFSDLGTAIGRYPEDQYDGVRTGSRGNPWFLTTAAFASYHYKLARHLKQSGSLEVTPVNQKFLSWVTGHVSKSVTLVAGKQFAQGSVEFKTVIDGLVKTGDDYLKRIRMHINQETGDMAEQIDRKSGYMRGASDLTWSYSSFVNAYLDRFEALE
jgi:glucoamylase